MNSIRQCLRRCRHMLELRGMFSCFKVVKYIDGLDGTVIDVQSNGCIYTVAL